MNITDELREYAGNFYLFRYKDVREKLDAIADLIDKRYEEMHGFCERLYRATINHEDVTLWDVDYTTLPVDADGEPIHIGDMVENNERVVRIILTDGSCEPSVCVEKSRGYLHQYLCNEVSHYHESTVEDVLREFALRVAGRECMTARPDVIAEYAAKLRLANSEE